MVPVHNGIISDYGIIRRLVSPPGTSYGKSRGELIDIDLDTIYRNGRCLRIMDQIQSRIYNAVIFPDLTRNIKLYEPALDHL